MITERIKILLMLACLFFAGILSGCASVGGKSNVLALVNGAPVTEDDLRFALDITHRREDLGKTSFVDISEYLDRLISNRLIAEEARRMGLEESPEIQEKIQTFILQQSVMKLHDEEVRGKVSVSDDEVRDYYFKNYGKVSVGLIEVENEGLAAELAQRIEKGEDFGLLAQEYSTHHNSAKNDGKIEYTTEAIEKSSRFKEIIDGLEPGEISDSEEIDGKYYIIRFDGREDAPADGYADAAPGIKTAIRKEKETRRGDDYLAELRAQADIELYDDIIATLNIEETIQKKDEWRDDTRVLARVYDKVLTVADLFSLLQKGGRRAEGKPADFFVNNWIDFEVVDHEALKRRYVETDPALNAKMERYIDELGMRMFLAVAIEPKITVTDEKVADFYAGHHDKYRTPVLYRFEEISASTRAEADEIMRSLEKGADFQWILTQKKGKEEMDIGPGKWISEHQLPPRIREAAASMSEGDISPVLESGDAGYSILRVSARKGGDVMALEHIKDRVVKDYVEDQAEKIRADFIEKLKEDAEIIIYEERVEALKNRFVRTPSLDKSDG